MNREQKAQVIEEVAGAIHVSPRPSSRSTIAASPCRRPPSCAPRCAAPTPPSRVVKNTLAERAADQVGADGLKELLQGPTAMTFVRGDAAAAAKALRDFRRGTQNTLLEFKGGWMNGAAAVA